MPVDVQTDGVVVRDLRVELLDGTDIIDDISFEIGRGGVLALVGESGCGKTATALAMLGYARPGSRIARGRIRIGAFDVLEASGGALRQLRGSLVSYVPQDPSTSLNPAHRIGDQILEMLLVHRATEAAADSQVARLLELVQLPVDEEFQRRYPHQLSGGQQQRVCIAMALACEPKLVVLDEPTTGLDVTTQKRIIEVIDELRRAVGVALLYVTHDLSVVAELADEVAVMYGGRIVEIAAREAAFAAARHPYTIKLIRSIPEVERRTHLVGIPGTAVAPGERPPGCPFEPRCEHRIEACAEAMPPRERVDSAHEVRCFRWRDLSLEARESTVDAASPVEAGESLLTVRDLVATYARGRRGGEEAAVRGVSFELGRRECLAIVGESGSGKTTVARCLAGLHAPKSGAIEFDGQALAPTARGRPLEIRRRIQLIFQNPDFSLNPRQTVREIIRRPFQQFFGDADSVAASKSLDLLELVRLPARLIVRYPGELSGGEKQRVAIARALAADPALVVCDEITSALDVSVQAAIIDLLGDLRARLETSFLFISHDLAVVRSIADRIAVMHDGEIVEQGASEEIFTRPQADYTRRLLAAVPSVARAAGSDSSWTLASG